VRRIDAARRVGASVWLGLVGLALAGCLAFPPELRYEVQVRPQEELLGQGGYYWDAEDSSTVFEVEGFRLKLRHLSDAELNDEYARHTFREPNLNPFTYGTDRDLDLGYSPPRFTVFEMTVVNQAYPKVTVDPAKMVLHTDRGGEYGSWAVLKRDGPDSFEQYYMERRGEGGNEEHYYRERMGVVREALYRRNTWVWKGERYSAKVVFAPLHEEVRAVTLRVPGIVLRVDAYDRATEVVEAELRFGVRQRVMGGEGTP